ncbi:hypothetical protein ACJQWK_08829 [Exserohilum turcicum]
MALFRRIQAGRDLKNNTRTDYNLKREEYDRIQRALLQDEELRCFVETKIQCDIYDYIGDRRRLAVRRPTNVHRLFLDSVEYAIESQLESIRNGPGRKARFVQNIRLTRPSTICLPAKASSDVSRHDADAGLKHVDARYPGVIIEISYGQDD